MPLYIYEMLSEAPVHSSALTQQPSVVHEPKARGSATNRHLGHLDALRGIAILGVLIVHAAFTTQQIGKPLLLGFTGQRGVQLFYMISAFTLCLSLDGERKEQHPLSNYFIRRFFRIAPLFYFVIFLNLLLKYVAPAFSALRDLGRGDILLGFLFLNGTRPRAIDDVVMGGWSIAVETTFYLLLPLLFRYFNTVRRTLLLFVLSAPPIAYLCRHLVLGTHDPVRQQFFGLLWFPVEFPVFVLGMMTYTIWKEYIQKRKHTSARRKELSLLLLLCSVLIYRGCQPFSDFNIYSSSFLFVPLILALSLYEWPLLVNAFTRFIGKISYSLYLLHFFGIFLVWSILKHWNRSPSRPVDHYILHRHIGLPIFVVLLAGLSIPVCVLSWRYIEQPGIRLGRRLIAFREGRIATAAAIPLVPSIHILESDSNTRDAQF